MAQHRRVSIRRKPNGVLMLAQTTTPLWFGTDGPVDAPIVVVGEAWGSDEAITKKPFQGAAGHQLDQMLNEAGIDRRSVLCTNLISARPQGNEMWRFFHPKKQPSGLPTIRGLDPTAELRADLLRLYAQLAAFPRKLVIGCGNYPLWALTKEAGVDTITSSNNRAVPIEQQCLGPTRITMWRGSMIYVHPHTSESPSTTPLLPILHPAAILRQWDQRAIAVHDLKARIKLALKDDWRHPHSVQFLAPPTYEECIKTLQIWLLMADNGDHIRLAEDIETSRGFITCLGLADSTTSAMCIPFVRLKDDRSFTSWWTTEEEATIIGLLHRINSHPNIQIEGQNFIYDTQYIQYWLGSSPKLEWDSNLAQNVLFPGTPKDLAHLSSLYCKYHWFWKEDHKEWNLKGRIEDLLVYNCWDCVRTFEVCTSQRQTIAAAGLSEQMQLKLDIHNLCIRMMNRGVRIDLARRGPVLHDMETASAALESELLTIIPQALVRPDADKPWYRSPKQTAFLFYDRLGFEVQHDRKTKRPTVGKDARSVLRRKYPEFEGLFNRLALYGSIEIAIDVLNCRLEENNRLVPGFNPAGTETHRLSSSKNAFNRGMNCQNLSVGDDDD